MDTAKPYPKKAGYTYVTKNLGFKYKTVLLGGYKYECEWCKKPAKYHFSYHVRDWDEGDYNATPKWMQEVAVLVAKKQLDHRWQSPPAFLCTVCTKKILEPVSQPTLLDKRRESYWKLRAIEGALLDEIGRMWSWEKKEKWGHYNRPNTIIMFDERNLGSPQSVPLGGKAREKYVGDLWTDYLKARTNTRRARTLMEKEVKTNGKKKKKAS